MAERLFYPATERNREPILSVLQEHLPPKGRILEIASGSGEHVVHFAKSYPHITWHPSDLGPDCLNSIKAWRDHYGLSNIESPLQLDTTKAENWPEFKVDALICINMVHISPWPATEGLMKKASQLLKKEGFLYLYGPYKKNGQHTAPSNVAFDQQLQATDSRFGVRDMERVVNEAEKNGLKLTQTTAMPANNFSLFFHTA
ncbi:DUF938 domain-containing protein [Terasakiella sp. SH-1]|uniref:DUF938 domain-containing protein n=1 Tax=Terasakiella sp. SH-1 TaxID=2560057 RepID=UPI001073441A|nr:DUF938 domain-containing protein [Terasakiella sp. SH-1]